MTPEERDRAPLSVRRLLIRGLPIALLCAVACAYVAHRVSASREPVYDADAVVLMRDSSDPVAGPQPGTIEGQGVATDSLLVARRPVLERVAKREHDLTVDELRAAVTVAPVGKTNALRVTASANDAERAAHIANVVARAFVAIERERIKNRAGEAVQILRKQLSALSSTSRRGAAGAQVRQQMQGLGLTEQLGTVVPRVVDPAEPAAAPTSPQPRRDAIFGAIGGFVLGVGLAVLWVASDRRVRDAGEASELLGGVRALATFRRRRSLGRLFRVKRGSDEEASRLVLLSLRHLQQKEPLRSVSVMPVARNEGRTRVAWGLATTAAASGQRA